MTSPQPGPSMPAQLSVPRILSDVGMEPESIHGDIEMGEIEPLTVNPFINWHVDEDGVGYVNSSGEKVLFCAGTMPRDYQLAHLVNQMQDIQNNEFLTEHLPQLGDLNDDLDVDLVMADILKSMQAADEHPVPPPSTYAEPHIPDEWRPYELKTALAI
ncbi:hypothetical protein FOMPIDRAFT_112904 [Fomitopsis schrenkii]|uniref:Uncharacterized protein n=1 Tax=Fomitopsis schrenkii TaxID=2126942 RepID=S8DT56_FOMSC|nr:hypothetical protein FOMPIDRAFT_112904 [Fomitopsis schrenkii]